MKFKIRRKGILTWKTEGEEETQARSRAYERYALTESIKWKFFVKEWLTPSSNPYKQMEQFTHVTLNYTM